MSRIPEACSLLASADLPADLKSRAITNLNSPAYPVREELASLILHLASARLLQICLPPFLQQYPEGETIYARPPTSICSAADHLLVSCCHSWPWHDFFKARGIMACMTSDVQRYPAIGLTTGFCVVLRCLRALCQHLQILMCTAELQDGKHYLNR